MTFLRLYRAGVAIVAMAFVAACGDTPLDIGEPDFRGTVELIRTDNWGTVVRLADVEPANNEPLRDVRISASTRILLRRSDGSLTSAGVSDIEIGRILGVKHSGVVLNRYPAEYGASWVEILPSG